MPQRARADIRNPQPEDLVGPGFAADLLRFFGMGEAPNAADLISPVGAMARIGKSGNKFIELFVGREGRIFDTDPLGNRSGTHTKFVKEKFNEGLDEFLRKGGVRGSESGLEFAVDAAGKPIAAKKTLDRGLQTMLRSFTEKGFSVDDTLRIDKLRPDGTYMSVETPLIEALRKRF